MKISRNTVATISYTVTETDGKVVGRTEPGHPVEALIGHGFLVKGLELALDGHEKGDEFAITLNPADAYGEINEAMIQTIDRAMFGDFDVQVGNVFEADSNHGPMAVVVKEVKDDKVIVDGNHPLAGKVLNFLIVVDDVREASAEEIAHGHVHHGGHCPSEEHEHGCCCGRHHHHDEEGEHHCCGRHHHDEDHECGCGHHHDDEEHECCCGHHHDEDGEHHCCGGHHHDEEGEHHCCGRHHHDEDHECGCGHHHDEEGEHHCCGSHQH